MADGDAGDTVTIIPGRTVNAAASLFPGLEAYASGQAYLQPGIMSAYEEGHLGRLEIVRQARQVERRSESIRGGIDRKTNTVVGAELFPQLTPDYQTLGLSPEWAVEFARRGEALFKSWAIDRRKLADAEGHHTFGGLMWLAMRNVTGPDGESFGIIHYDVARARRLRSPWNTTVTVLDPQRVQTPPVHSGRQDVVEGKLLDDYGRMLGFYFNRMPRGPGAFTDLEYGFCPRENRAGRPMGWHHFSKHRGAAQRGITGLVTMLRRAGKLDKFDDAKLGAAIVEAAMATYLKTKGTTQDAHDKLAPAGSTAANDFDLRVGLYDRLKLRIGPTRIPVLAPDDEIHIATADRSSGDPSAFRSGFLRDFASSIGGLTAESLSLDYSKVNYSSARAAMVDIWRGVIAERTMFCASAPSLIVEAVLEECIVKGWLPLPEGAPPFQAEREAYTRCMWTGPAMGWVDPKKEAEAAHLRTDPSRPLSTLTDEAASQGRSFDEIVATTLRERTALVQAGLIPSVMVSPAPGTAPAANEPDDDEREPPEQREE